MEHFICLLILLFMSSICIITCCARIRLIDRHTDTQIHTGHYTNPQHAQQGLLTRNKLLMACARYITLAMHALSDYLDLWRSLDSTGLPATLGFMDGLRQLHQICSRGMYV